MKATLLLLSHKMRIIEIMRMKKDLMRTKGIVMKMMNIMRIMSNKNKVIMRVMRAVMRTKKSIMKSTIKDIMKQVIRKKPTPPNLLPRPKVLVLQMKRNSKSIKRMIRKKK